MDTGTNGILKHFLAVQMRKSPRNKFLCGHIGGCTLLSLQLHGPSIVLLLNTHSRGFSPSRLVHWQLSPINHNNSQEHSSSRHTSLQLSKGTETGSVLTFLPLFRLSVRVTSAGISRKCRSTLRTPSKRRYNASHDDEALEYALPVRCLWSGSCAKARSQLHWQPLIPNSRLLAGRQGWRWTGSGITGVPLAGERGEVVTLYELVQVRVGRVQ